MTEVAVCLLGAPLLTSVVAMLWPARRSKRRERVAPCESRKWLLWRCKIRLSHRSLEIDSPQGFQLTNGIRQAE